MAARPHFRIFGIPVRIEPLFWVVTVLIAYRFGDARIIIMWTAVVLVSILVHELGHALVLAAFGQRSAIVLHGFGGLTLSQRRLPKAQSIIVSLAGPLSALVLLGLPLMLLRDSPWGTELEFDYVLSDQVFGLWPVVFFAAYVNVWWSILNLLPIRPLDGGHVATELFGIRAARLASVVVGAAAAVWAYTQADGFQFAAFFFGFLAFINLSEHRRAAQGQPAPSAFDVDGPDVPGGGPGARRGQSGTVTPIRPQRPSGWPSSPPTQAPGPAGLDPAAAESLAWNQLRQGNGQGALRTLRRSSGPVGQFVSAAATAASGGGIDDLIEAYGSNPSGPSNLVPAVVADDLGRLDDLVDRLLERGAPGREAVSSIQTHLHYAERFRSSAEVGRRLHQAAPGAQVAFDVACALSRAGEGPEAVTWLHEAVDRGFGAAALLDGEPDLAAARVTAGWAELRGRLPAD